LLDGFLAQHSERLIADPLKRAVFQRDLLAVYYWLSLASDEQAASRSALQNRVAEVIHRLALTEDQIGKLPDNYDDAIRAQVFPPQIRSRRSEAPILPQTFSIRR